MLQVLFLGGTLDKNVIKIYHQELTHKRSQHLSHYPHKCTGSVGQTKRHNHPLVQTIFRLEGCLPFISWSNADLMISTLEVNFLKDSSTGHHVKHVIETWDWKPILDSDLINSPAIYTHAPCAVFLGCQEGWHSARA